METAIASPVLECPQSWPADVKLIISVLEQQTPLFEQRRSLARNPYRVLAGLEIAENSHVQSGRAVPIYTRDANARGLGFVTSRSLPVGSRARLHLPIAPDRSRWIDCSIIRCRSFVDGWFDGAVIFDYEEAMFEKSCT